MKVYLDGENQFLTKDGKVNQKEAFIYSGIKAAWCYKKGTTTPENIRETSEENLIRMGMETFLNDHGTPDEHYNVSIEIINIPKIMCMILNNLHQYTACERSLRYTKVLPSKYITPTEVNLYNKWHQIYVNIFETKYKDFFMKANEGNEEEAKKSMRKIAQELARQFVSVLTPTSIAYTAPWYQWQKIADMLIEMANSPQSDLEKLIAPYAKDLVNQLTDLKVIVLTKDALGIYPDLKNKLKDDRKWLYRNNKGIQINLFAARNKFSGIKKPNSFGSAINYNSQLSFSATAHFHRHRTIDVEIEVPNEFNSFMPEFIKNTELEQEYLKDMQLVKDLYPQGQLLDINVNGSLKNIIEYVGQERACERAQQEIENWYVNTFLPDIVKGFEANPEYQKEYEMLKKEYLNKCRCAFPGYTCPNPCGRARTKRPF